MDKLSAAYLKNVQTLFRYYESLGRKAIDQVPEEFLKKQPSEASNSIAVMVKHLHGNMLSRWTDFLQSDGEKEWRNRDGEFEDTIENKAQLMALWTEGWTCCLEAIEGLKPEDVMRLAYIRNEGHTVQEAINRQLGHYSYHVGQLVFLAKHWVGNSWQSLSIPKGESKVFNKEKFEKPKERKNFV